jgi:hypothetical protein
MFSKITRARRAGTGCAGAAGAGMHVSGALVMALEVRRPGDVPKRWCGRALNGKQDAKAQAHKRKRPRSAVFCCHGVEGSRRACHRDPFGERVAALAALFEAAGGPVTRAAVKSCTVEALAQRRPGRPAQGAHRQACLLTILARPSQTLPQRRASGGPGARVRAAARAGRKLLRRARLDAACLLRTLRGGAVRGARVRPSACACAAAS